MKNEFTVMHHYCTALASLTFDSMLVAWRMNLYYAVHCVRDLGITNNTLPTLCRFHDESELYLLCKHEKLLVEMRTCGEYEDLLGQVGYV